MRVIITGMNGTVAPAVAGAMSQRGWTSIAWDRRTDPPATEADVRRVIDGQRPDLVCHIATGPLEWAQWIAEVCAARRTALIWTSTVSVFSESAKAPIPPEATPDAADGYGAYKAQGERRVRGAHPGAIIARLGWQIAQGPGSNSMTDHLCRAAEASGGRIEASTRWIPSCAMLRDTASAIADLAQRNVPGTYNLEGNAAGSSMFDLARGIAAMLERPWVVAPAETPVRDNRMSDHRVVMGQLDRALRLRN